METSYEKIQIIVAVAFLVLSGGLSLWFYLVKRKNNASLDVEGVVVPALIVGVDEYGEDEKQRCFLRFEYVVEELGSDRPLRGSQQVDCDKRPAMAVGETAIARYLPSDPAVSRLEEYEHLLSPY